MAAQPVWVEIPVKNIERALRFYTGLFGGQAQIADDGVRRTATLTSTSGGAGLSLNQTASFEPGMHGPLVYLDAGEDLSDTLAKVVPAGGKVVIPKTSMGQAGNFATFQDTEGNILALYSVR